MNAKWIVASIAGYGECAYWGEIADGGIASEGRVKGENLTKVFAHPSGAFAFVKAKNEPFDFPASAVSGWMPAPEEWIEVLAKTWSGLVLK